MTLDQLHTYYDYNWSNVAKELQVSPMTVYRWRKHGAIPPKWQMIIQQLTENKLAAKWEDTL